VKIKAIYWLISFKFLSNIDPFPPPTDVHLSDVNVQSGRISFNWTSVDAQCDSISYNITSINCGRCPTTSSNNTVTCSDARFSGQVCTFIVQAVVCGNIVGNLGVPISVIMKGKAIPKSISVYHPINFDIILCSSKSFSDTQCTTL
jgi:hypothetical protein